MSETPCIPFSLSSFSKALRAVSKERQKRGGDSPPPWRTPTEVGKLFLELSSER